MRKKSNEGFILLSTLILVSVIGILSTAYIKNIITIDKREKEKEFVFHLIQLKKGIDKYKVSNDRYPDDLNVLLEEKYIRKKFRDPFRIHSSDSWLDDWEYSIKTGDIHSKSNKISMSGKKYIDFYPKKKELKYQVEVKKINEENSN